MSWINVLLLKAGICSLMAEALGIGLLFWHATVLQALHVFACIHRKFSKKLFMIMERKKNIQILDVQ